MVKEVAYLCVHCSKNVSGRHHALSCSVCNRWQHRKCHTGIDHVVYRLMVQGVFQHKWKCNNCKPAPEEPEDMNKKESFLKNFGLGRVVHGIESEDEDDYLPLKVVLEDSPPCPVVINTPQRSKVTARRRLQSSGGSGITPLRVSRLGPGGWQVARKSVSPTTGNNSPPVTPIKVTKKSPGSLKASRMISRDALTDNSPPVTPLQVSKKPSGNWRASRKVLSSSDISPPVTPLQFTKRLSGIWRVSRRSSSSLKTPESQNDLQLDEEEVFKSEIEHNTGCRVPSCDLPWMPKIISVFSEATGDEIDTGEDVIDDDNVHSTCMPIEECPRCCTVLVPGQFTVNVVTAVMKTMCQCGLNIEISPKPTICKTNTVFHKRKRNESNIHLKYLRFV